MRDLIIFGLFIILLLAAQFASSKTVDEIIEKYVKARGGKDKLSALKSIYMEGIKEKNGTRSIIKITKEQARLSRVEIETHGATEFELITDEGAFFPFRHPGMDKVDGKDLVALQTEMDIAGPLAGYGAKGYKAELLGKEMVEGNTCYKIRLTTKDGVEAIFWIDSDTYLINQSLTPGIVDNKVANGQTMTTYRNYRAAEDILFPHTVEVSIRGAGSYGISGEINFYKIILNPAIDSKMFLPEIAEG